MRPFEGWVPERDVAGGLARLIWTHPEQPGWEIHEHPAGYYVWRGPSPVARRFTSLSDAVRHVATLVAAEQP